jgi:hypothetical protein
MISTRRLALLSLSAATLLACKPRRDEVPCSAVAARMLVIAQAETQSAKVAEEMRQRVAIQLPAVRDAIDGACESGKWSLEMRRCMVTAADAVALAACQRLLTDEQRAALARTTAKPE